MIIDFIEKLQDKPKHVRARIMWLAVFVSMTVIFFIWIISLKHTFQKNAGAPLIPKEVINSVEKVKEQMPANKNNFNAGINSLFDKSQNQTENSPFEK